MRTNTNVVQSIRILLVENDPDVQSLYSYVLSGAGYHVIAVGSAHEALEKMRNNQFSLILTDYQMPEMNGDTLITLIHDCHQVPYIILISADPDIVDIARKSGADAYFHKGDPLQRLLSCIAGTLH